MVLLKVGLKKILEEILANVICFISKQDIDIKYFKILPNSSISNHPSKFFKLNLKV